MGEVLHDLCSSDLLGDRDTLITSSMIFFESVGLSNELERELLVEWEAELLKDPWEGEWLWR